MKIAISGSHGTGKSSVLQALEARGGLDGLAVVAEVPRAMCGRVSDDSFFHRGQNSLTRQLLLVAAQITEEAVVSTPVVAADRSVVDHWAYTLSILSEHDRDRPEVGEVRRLVEVWAPTYDRVFYLPVEFDLEIDNLREEDLEFQREIDETLRGEYRRLGVDLVELSGSVDERVSALLAGIPSPDDNLLPGAPSIQTRGTLSELP